MVISYYVGIGIEHRLRRRARSEIGVRYLMVLMLLLLVAFGGSGFGQTQGSGDKAQPDPLSCITVELGTGERRCIVPGSQESFRDCPLCPEMVVVPAGTVTM